VLLQLHLMHGLDLLNAAQFQEIDARLGPEYSTLSVPFIEMRIRDTTDYASTLFYIEIKKPGAGTVFRSTNLQGKSIPDVKGQDHYSVKVHGLGEMRAAEFHAAPLEITIATPLRQTREVMRSYVQVCVALLFAMLVASLLIGLRLSRMVLAPVRSIRDTANRIRSDNLSERIPVGKVRDEISDLARLLNQMFDRLEISFEQVRRFTAEASHELKTPLSLVRLHAEKMLTDESLTPAHREAVQVQLEEVERLNRVIEDLLFLSRAEAHAISLDLQEQPPEQFLKGFVQDAAVLAEHHGCRLSFSHSGEGKARFEARWMRQVLLNLVVNAIHVSPPGGNILLESTLGGGSWRLIVEDEGHGLTAQQREQMFGRFVRFAAPGKDRPGTGLGLAICRSIVELHGGTIHAIAGRNGVGLRVVTQIPDGTSG
jgi:signal transduction histidine kinase